MNFEVRNGYFSYKTAKIILKDISFSVNSGEILAILGPNGVGKTTLLKCLMGLLKWNKGASYIDGCELTTLKFKEIWQNIAYVPQAKTSTLAIPVREMVVLGRNVHISDFKKPTKKDYEMADEALCAVKVASLSEKLCSELSGGELQMVLIARALSSHPKLLVLDEPESNLDFKNQLVILQMLRQLAKKNDVSIIVNTHYPAHALQISDKSLILQRDGCHIYGESAQVITEENLQKTFAVKVKIEQFYDGNRAFKTVIPLDTIE